MRIGMGIGIGIGTTIRVCILLVLLVLQLYYMFDSAPVEVAVGGVSLSMYCVVCASHA